MYVARANETLTTKLPLFRPFALLLFTLPKFTFKTWRTWVRLVPLWHKKTAPNFLMT